MIWDSFFDDPASSEYCIWKKDVTQADYDDLKVKENIIFEGHLSKYDKDKQAFKQYYFVLTKRRLYYKKVAKNHPEKISP